MMSSLNQKQLIEHQENILHLIGQEKQQHLGVGRGVGQEVGQGVAQQKDLLKEEKEKQNVEKQNIQKRNIENNLG